MPASLHTRVGIVTGLVVVGDLIGSGESQERGIVGETPNLAARLQSIAEPDSVVIGESKRENCSAICSNFKTSGQGNLKASQDSRGPRRSCERARWRADSRRCTRHS